MTNYPNEPFKTILDTNFELTEAYNKTYPSQIVKFSFLQKFHSIFYQILAVFGFNRLHFKKKYFSLIFYSKNVLFFYFFDEK